MIHRYVLFDNYVDELGISENPLMFPYSTIICGVGGILDWFCVFLVSYNVWQIWNYTSEFKHKRMELNTYIWAWIIVRSYGTACSEVPCIHMQYKQCFVGICLTWLSQYHRIEYLYLSMNHSQILWYRVFWSKVYSHPI